MRTFKDTKGRQWELAVNVSAIRRVKALAQVDLLEVLGGRLIDRLLNEPETLADVLFALVRDQAAAQSITSEDFGAGLAGDAIDDATKALLEELADFFPSARRTLLRTALTKVREAESAAMERGTREITERAAEEIRRIQTLPTDQLIQQTPGGPSTRSPASSEGSTPAPSPSAS